MCACAREKKNIFSATSKMYLKSFKLSANAFESLSNHVRRNHVSFICSTKNRVFFDFEFRGIQYIFLRGSVPSFFLLYCHSTSYFKIKETKEAKKSFPFSFSESNRFISCIGVSSSSIERQPFSLLFSIPCFCRTCNNVF